MCKQKNIKNAGFTLIEVMLYVVIASVMLPAISVFLSTTIESRVKNQTIGEVEQQGMQVMQIISQVIRNGATINTPAIGTSAITLSVDTIVPANNPTILSIVGGVVFIKEGTALAVPLTNSRVTASNISVTNLSRVGTPGTLRIIYTLTHKNPSGRYEYDFSKTFIGTATLRQP